MSSRAKFSFGWAFLFWLASSQMSIAGPLAMAWVRASNGPAPLARNSWFWASMNEAKRTFWIDVAKWPCQKNVSFSARGCSVATIRPIHQSTIARPSCCRWAWSALRAVGSVGTGAKPASCGTATASAAGVGAWRPAMMDSTVAA